MRANCSPQSELGPALLGLAPPCGLATHCTGHCTTCAAQGIKGPCWFGVILTFLPVIPGSPLWHLKHKARVALVTGINRTSHDTSWRPYCLLLLKVWTIPSSAYGGDQRVMIIYIIKLFSPFLERVKSLRGKETNFCNFIEYFEMLFRKSCAW